MDHFIDREDELAALEKEYTRGESALVIMYGRRRIGKTSLVREFIKNKPAIYYLVTEESEAQNREAFKNMVADFTGNTLLKNTTPEDWGLIFDTLAARETPAKKVVVIDEFQYLGKANPAFPSILQKIWDTNLKDRKIMLILCGSLISMMESQTLSYGSPLYGRRTAQIRLKQIPFRYYGAFFPDKSRNELVQYYAVTGGVPKYIELFSGRKNIYRAIAEDVLSRNSFLYDEPGFLLLREVSQTGSYFSVIKTIAAGNHKLADIAASLGQKQTGLTKYLNTLINLDILRREVPVTENNPEKSKRGLYRITDNFMLFWFKFVYPNQSYIESGNTEVVMDKIRRNFIDSHVSYVYEGICREELGFRWPEQWRFRVNRIGRWWDNHNEIDLVAYDGEGEDMVFGECKYRKGKMSIDVLFGLMEKSQKVEWKRQERRNHYALFSIGGFCDELIRLAENRDDVVLLE
ncbi:MAG: ATP-binding protein [Spirochaetaceae bacterium]|jgi:AAA+ ATPase superfamily predicted ATPase|nr:ATP-binding protein [Spirochaetaceae bacterium]